MSTTADLVPRAMRGDPDAFQALIHEEKEKLYRMAYMYMRNEADALEVFQETVYKAFKSISSLQNSRYFSTWLTRILINTAISYLKKNRKITAMSPEVLEHIGDSYQHQPEDQLDLLQAIGTLEEKYKTVLLLRYYKDYSLKQIAEVLDCPEGTVKTNIHRGLSVLRNKLKGAACDDPRDSFL
ncbi:RNA polymerase sigma-70 factor (ECF subfamily) [Paenibacillus forsythiae]|uniref:RNA polymerase sigma-70 factor (ECF subfamily) n=1 Tax=Paenibacillus forsythiae TaxID=365616 RepID=A0ABU3HD26_9BACL|nr:sigma-70 family RNA polymerase sigma factor [Paenibacillus forsythiae]MDT3428722.1 RNA polymerase sigma-70 factor (ECF subfamily) [Paenibacillus forsythiae]